ncbi:MAG: rhomboid family intramembrane serine protease [Chlamydiota bacterium]
MRIIGTLKEESLATRFSLFLRKEAIDHAIDAKLDPEKGIYMYEVWIHNEDEIDRAISFFQDFMKNPQDSRFTVTFKELPLEKEEEILEEKIKEVEKKLFLGKGTSFFIFICSLFFLINGFQDLQLSDRGTKEWILTPIQSNFLYDLTPQMEALSSFATSNKIDLTKKWDELDPITQKELSRINSIPSWQGLYFSWVHPPKKDFQPAPILFEKIRKGEVWRIFTPSFMHVGFFHILFNMLWLWALGRQIEKRILGFRFVLLVFLLAAVSNTAQYFMGGAAFFGFSGVVTGLGGFIFERQRIAPWEGYPLSKLAIGFLGFYIILLVVLEFFLFSVQMMGLGLFSSKIANTAHITGAICGILLAKIPFFGEKSFES